jgi:SAM-dependent methyltransferase
VGARIIAPLERERSSRTTIRVVVVSRTGVLFSWMRSTLGGKWRGAWPRRPDGGVAEASNAFHCIVCDRVQQPSSLPGLVYCGHCGLVSADARVTPQDLIALYGRHYINGSEYLDYEAEEESLRANFRSRITTLRRLIPQLGEKRLLDIGCAYGFFLREVSGDVAEAIGIDLSAEAVKRAVESVKVRAARGDYLAYAVDPPVDVITMWDTIEHLADPHLYVAKAARDMAPGGVIAITTGDIDSVNARLRGRRWRMIHPPTHLHYFSVTTIRRLLELHGFEVIHVSHPGVRRTLRSMLYGVLSVRLGWTSLYERMRGLPGMGVGVTMNLWDIMFVVARRRAGGAGIDGAGPRAVA